MRAIPIFISISLFMYYIFISQEEKKCEWRFFKDSGENKRITSLLTEIFYF